MGKAPVQQSDLTEQNTVYERNRRQLVQVEVHSELESLLLAEDEGHDTVGLLAQLSPLAAACCCLLSLVAVRNIVCRHDSKFKSPPSHPLNDNRDDVRSVRTVDWLPELYVNTGFGIAKKHYYYAN